MASVVVVVDSSGDQIHCSLIVFFDEIQIFFNDVECLKRKYSIMPKRDLDDKSKIVLTQEDQQKLYRFWIIESRWKMFYPPLHHMITHTFNAT